VDEKLRETQQQADIIVTQKLNSESNPTLSGYFQVASWNILGMRQTKRKANPTAKKHFVNSVCFYPGLCACLPACLRGACLVDRPLSLKYRTAAAASPRDDLKLRANCFTLE
jgi:hypothetical protein